jgi:hypothetical protein
MKKLILILILTLSSCNKEKYQKIDLPSEKFTYLNVYEIQIIDIFFTDTITLPNVDGIQEIEPLPVHESFIAIGIELSIEKIVDNNDIHQLTQQDFRLKSQKELLPKDNSYDYFPPNVSATYDLSWENHSLKFGEIMIIKIYFLVPNHITFENAKIIFEINFNDHVESELSIDLT